MHNYDAAYFVVVVCLPIVARLLMMPRIGTPARAAAERLAARLWVHLLEREEPDELVLRRWALVNLDQLEQHLARVRQLVLTDDDMSATRQLGNRLAYEHLQVDVADAVAAVPERVEKPPTVTWRPPAADVRYLPEPRFARASGIEVIQFGPTGRWF